ncbi:glycoside hydrolase family 71 protein [Zasmidium cellare ATCC 36951]|uniref:Glycoside hydrolase family 71 protein n=1 Tax=Zasmidium cellare ATCC 36951 TaxID=1080233 RepID=A0A6A6C4F6_ZASCE|nr:glycoside hydrolase family 71 protein [Zasmidium cellare ATCC 36951]KAF2161911.1 glycoside hydrolase family 71 protein [Zasmidium cellare ATCC 36951]
MHTNFATKACAIAALLPTAAIAQSVFAHVIVGNTASYTIEQWTSEIELAQSYGIDAFVLNIGTPFEGNTATQASYAFQACNALSSGFKMFFSFDYNGGTDGPWSQSDIITILQAYAPNGCHFQYDGKALVSTFEGTSTDEINAWPSIRAAVNHGLYFVPDWTLLGPHGFDTSLVDGAFSWDMWPAGAHDVSTTSDVAWDEDFLTPAGKTYMMGVSPWFYTDLPYKAWVWRGDSAWSLRWNQTLQIVPEFVEIATWNDYGESHYIGPIVSAGIPSGAERYVENYPHTGWLETLPYQIAAYKHAYSAANPTPSVAAGEEKIVYWYRTSPASAGSTNATGNYCPSPYNAGAYQSCVPITDILEDEVFAIVLASQAGTASITIGGSTSTFSVSSGNNFVRKAFQGNTGVVSVGMGSVSGSGVEITAAPASGIANYNAWVGCAGSCRSI